MPTISVQQKKLPLLECGFSPPLSFLLCKRTEITSNKHSVKFAETDDILPTNNKNILYAQSPASIKIPHFK